MITLKQAYDKGWASQGTDVDWDDAAIRFDHKYAPIQPSPHRPLRACDTELVACYNLSNAWADGWSDRMNNHKKGHALRCTAKNYGGHAECEPE